jgi:predicted hotdog family 3-hydroxylacyl-ACP dehydratase
MSVIESIGTKRGGQVITIGIPVAAVAVCVFGIVLYFNNRQNSDRAESLQSIQKLEARVGNLEIEEALLKQALATRPVMDQERILERLGDVKTAVEVLNGRFTDMAEQQKVLLARLAAPK